MNYKTKLTTEIATEPLTLAEVKQQLRLDSVSFEDDIETEQSIVPGSHAVVADYGLEGTGIDVLNDVVLVQVNAGDCSSGTVDVKIQESDDDSTYADWYSFTQISSSNDNQVHEKEYTGTKQYVRCVATVATAACEFSCDVIVNSYETAEDSLLSSYITSAREFGEDFTKHAFAAQTWNMYLEDFPHCKDYIEWFMPPLTSITSVTIKDSDGDETVLTENTHYIVDVDTFPGKIFLPYGESWYDFIPFPYNAVTIKGVCGYTGTEPYILPKAFKQAMLMHVAYMYRYRDVEIPDKCLNTIKRLYSARRAAWF